jgi:hypothetical protein
MLDLFMPVYEVADLHRAFVAAPADVTLAAAAEMDFAEFSKLGNGFCARSRTIRSGREDFSKR